MSKFGARRSTGLATETARITICEITSRYLKGTRSLIAEQSGTRSSDGHAGTVRHILAAFRLTALATVTTLLCGVATTKLIAVIGGPAAIALMGLYRTLAALFSRGLMLGFDTVIVQRISRANGKAEVAGTVRAIVLLIMLQGVALLVVGIAGASVLARWIFGPGCPRSASAEVQIVLAMAFANLVTQILTAALNGQVNLRQVATVGIVSSLASIAVIYPLLRLGRIGLAFNVGSGSIVGAAVALFYVQRAYGPGIWGVRYREAWGDLRNAAACSSFLIIHPFLMMGSILAVQAMIQRRYGIGALGTYVAATTVMDTVLMVLMSSVKTYFFPSLGKVQGEDKARFMNRVLTLNLATTSFGAVGLAFIARIAVIALFSSRFSNAADMVAMLSVSLLGQAMIWSYSSYILHEGNYGLFFTLDLVWAGTLVSGTWLCCRLNLPFSAVGVIYVASYSLSGLLYAGASAAKYGRRLLSPSSMRVGIAVTCWVLGAFAVTRLSALLPQLCYAGISFLCWCVILLRFRSQVYSGGTR